MRDFEKDGQRYSFSQVVRKGDRSLMRFTSGCAICNKPIQFDVVSFERANAAPSRRCEWHKLPSAPVGSRGEAIAIAANGWRVAAGSVLDAKRRTGRAWTATVTTLAPTGALAESEKVKRSLPKNEVAMAMRILAEGPMTAPRAAEGTTMNAATARTYATRLVARGLLKRVSWGVFDLTPEGQRFFASSTTPGPLVPMSLVGLDDEPSIGLFD